MERFDRFYVDQWIIEAEFGNSAGGILLETSNSGISRVYNFDFQERDSLQIIISRNDAGLTSLGWEKENLIKRLSETTHKKFNEILVEKLAKNYARATYVFMRLLGKGIPYQCWENDKMYLVYFPKANLTLEGTKNKYDFEFKGNENSKVYYFCANIENYTVAEEIVKGYNLISSDAISIFFIWQEFIPNMWGFDFDRIK